LYTPNTVAPRQNSQKFATESATTQISAPTMPMQAPKVKPARRPMRFISSDAKNVVAAAPTTQPVTGAVARLLFGARA
jgi:hypothetical protein